LCRSSLSEIPSRIEGLGPFESKIESAVQSGLALSKAHEPQLRVLMKCRNSIGAAAVTRLVELKGASVKDELLQSLVEARNDYNYCCNGIASALQPLATPDDARKIVALADSIKDEIPPGADDEVAHGFTSGAARFLSGLDVAVIREAFLPKDKSEPLSEVRARILCDFLREQRSTDALDLAGELLLRGIDKAATAMYFISNFSTPDDHLSWTTFSREHVDCLVLRLNEEDESWGLRALKCLCEGRPDLAEVVRARAQQATGVLKAALLHCASADSAHVFEALTELIGMGVEERGREPTHLLDQVELNWAGREALFVQLLRLRDARLAFALLEGEYGDQTLGECDIGPIDWWLEWLMKEGATESGYWLVDRMAWLFARVLNAAARHAFVAEFNKSGSRFRRLLAHSVLPHFPDLTTDILNEDAISFLLADLGRAGNAAWLHEHLLGCSATEQFVTERLLPLLPDAKPRLSRNLRRVLREAGSRHGRRYIRT